MLKTSSCYAKGTVGATLYSPQQKHQFGRMSRALWKDLWSAELSVVLHSQEETTRSCHSALKQENTDKRQQMLKNRLSDRWYETRRGQREFLANIQKNIKGKKKKHDIKHVGRNRDQCFRLSCTVWNMSYKFTFHVSVGFKNALKFPIYNSYTVHLYYSTVKL